MAAVAGILALVTAVAAGIFLLAEHGDPNFAQGRFRITPTQLDFGDVPVGTISRKTVTVTNISGSSIRMSTTGVGATDQFQGMSDCLYQMLEPGASCHMYYVFMPTAAGPAAGKASGSVSGQKFSLSFKGNGVAAVDGAATARLSISPTELDFGNVPVGTTGEQTVTVTNMSASPVMMNGTGGAAEGFGGGQDCQGRTLAPGASCTMRYTFTPSAPGPVTVTTSGTWNGQTYKLSLRGNGV